VCNARGNVLALMPHPERAQDLGALSWSVSGPWDERRRTALERAQADAAGPGLLLFESLRRYLEER
jgi:phosphoribosylformylglycinamidine (FGAM) synthase-like amidotransferase family enzyme